MTNQWTNRLAGDELLPEDKRKLDVFIGKFMGHYEPEPSGLIGPVRLTATDKQINNNKLCIPAGL